MPNHVHILAGLHQPGSLLRQCQAWKRYTATRINRLLGSSGRFWQRESWDHIVRSADEFERVRSYIAENPQRAGLDAAEYTLFVRAGSPS
jgi:REP element-mobilizing transposase RayT